MADIKHITLRIETVDGRVTEDQLISGVLIFSVIGPFGPNSMFAGDDPAIMRSIEVGSSALLFLDDTIDHPDKQNVLAHAYYLAMRGLDNFLHQNRRKLRHDMKRARSIKPVARGSEQFSLNLDDLSNDDQSRKN